MLIDVRLNVNLNINESNSFFFLHWAILSGNVWNITTAVHYNCTERDEQRRRKWTIFHFYLTGIFATQTFDNIVPEKKKFYFCSFSGNESRTSLDYPTSRCSVHFYIKFYISPLIYLKLTNWSEFWNSKPNNEKKNRSNATFYGYVDNSKCWIWLFQFLFVLLSLLIWIILNYSTTTKRKDDEVESKFVQY